MTACFRIHTSHAQRSKYTSLAECAAENSVQNSEVLITQVLDRYTTVARPRVQDISQTSMYVSPAAVTGQLQETSSSMKPVVYTAAAAAELPPQQYGTRTLCNSIMLGCKDTDKHALLECI